MERMVNDRLVWVLESKKTNFQIPVWFPKGPQDIRPLGPFRTFHTPDIGQIYSFLTKLVAKNSTAIESFLREKLVFPERQKIFESVSVILEALPHSPVKDLY